MKFKKGFSMLSNLNPENFYAEVANNLVDNLTDKLMIDCAIKHSLHEETGVTMFWLHFRIEAKTKKLCNDKFKEMKRLTKKAFPPVKIEDVVVAEGRVL